MREVFFCEDLNLDLKRNPQKWLDPYFDCASNWYSQSKFVLYWMLTTFYTKQISNYMHFSLKISPKKKHAHTQQNEILTGNYVHNICGMHISFSLKERYIKNNVKKWLEFTVIFNAITREFLFIIFHIFFLLCKITQSQMHMNLKQTIFFLHFHFVVVHLIIYILCHLEQHILQITTVYVRNFSHFDIIKTSM